MSNRYWKIDKEGNRGRAMCDIDDNHCILSDWFCSQCPKEHGDDTINPSIIELDAVRKVVGHKEFDKLAMKTLNGGKK